MCSHSVSAESLPTGGMAPPRRRKQRAPLLLPARILQNRQKDLPRAGKQASVSREHQRRHHGLPVLARAEELARAAQLEILLRDGKAVVGLRQRTQAVVGLGHQEAPALLRPAADAPAELMQLRKPKTLGVHSGYTKAWKKAIVTLAQGSKSIEFFDGMI